MEGLWMCVPEEALIAVIDQHADAVFVHRLISG